MILDILYSSTTILGQTNPFITGSGTTFVVYEPFVLSSTAPFTTGSGTVIEFKDMIDFIPPTRSQFLTSGSVSTYTFDSLTYEESNGLILGPTSLPAGKPYKETIIIK